MEGDSIIRMLLALAFVFALMVLVVFLLRKYGQKLNLGIVWPDAAQKKRLQHVETLVIDPKHRVVLFKRDEAEHLVILGGVSPVIIDGKKDKE
jgi:flagellar protein FliO/FliZ